MAQYYTTKIKECYEYQNAITGDTKFLYYELKSSIRSATRIDIIVSFLMESGVKLILSDLKAALERGCSIRILTGNYLNITQPSALYLLKKELKNQVELRFYNNPSKSFHPKAYIFHYQTYSSIYIGSSNISKSALTSGIEWNYRFTSAEKPNDFKIFYDTFEDLFYHHSDEITEERLKEYSRNWKRPNVQKDLDYYDYSKTPKSIIQPRGAQIEALYALEQSREEGFNKAVTVVPTGVGKTYLAAFDSKPYKRILFLAHRIEILHQAKESFSVVRPNDSCGYFYSDQKDTTSTITLALVQTLGKETYLNDSFFPKNTFDYIIVDEFHHAAAETYKRVINYFTPSFLLGLTATPERLDCKNVFELCDYNIVYDVRLKEAIQKGWLVPFRYYGIYDNTVNYDNITYLHGSYDDLELEQSLMIHQRADLILKHYLKYKSSRALGFCSSKKHADFMADYFTKNKISCATVYSGTPGPYNMDRNIAIEQLLSGNIKIIFSVDMFNEGVDLPSLDMVLFLRPTQSPTVFLQQLGRGLRLNKGKSYLTVLDFIGNYRKANFIPFLLTGESYSPSVASKNTEADYVPPDDCLIQFDFQLIDLFKQQAKQEQTLKERIEDEFQIITSKLNHVPSRVDLFTYMDSQIYEAVQKNSRLSPFQNYLEFLKERNLLTASELSIYHSFGNEFIHMIETTSMSKSYKMPLLLAFYNNGSIKMELTEDDIYHSFQSFYQKGSNKSDLLCHKSTANFMEWEKKQYVKLALDNPVKYMLKSHPDCFRTGEGFVLGLNEELKPLIKNESFLTHMKDSIEYRTIRYYQKKWLERV